MVCDNGKPDWITPEWTVLNIERKNPGKPNRWHPLVIGKRCCIEILELGRAGRLWIEGLVEWEEYSAYYTTPVLNIEGVNERLTVETTNSVYRLTRLEMEYQNEKV